ncbi:MAG: hypothetical protein ACI4PO_04625 [Faecousia sp.]
MTLERTVLGFPISAEVTKLDEGWDIGIFGGCRTHVGAVTLASPDGALQTLERPGHKDSFLSTRWAGELAERLNAPVCVRCGIHYDNATKQQLDAITACCDEMLRELMNAIAKSGF